MLDQSTSIWLEHRSVQKVIAVYCQQNSQSFVTLLIFLSFPLFFFLFLSRGTLCTALWIRYHQVTKAALRFFIPWSSWGKVPKFIPGVRALLLGAESPLGKSWELNRFTDLSFRISDNSIVQPDPSFQASLSVLPRYQLFSMPKGLVSRKNTDFAMEKVYQLENMTGFMHQLRGTNSWPSRTPAKDREAAFG